MQGNFSEDEKAALELVALKAEERRTGTEVIRLTNERDRADKAHAEAKEALKKARESFMRKMT